MGTIEAIMQPVGLSLKNNLDKILQSIVHSKTTTFIFKSITGM